MRLYIPLAPVVILAAVASVNACGKQPEPSDRLRVVPPPAALAEPAARPAAPVLAAAPEARPEADPTPSPEEVKAFERPVPK